MEQSIEQWLPVVGYEGAYEVSDRGRVRSVDRYVDGGHGNERLARGRILSRCVHQRGYLMVHLYEGNRRSAKYVHRLVLEAFVGPAPVGTEACHGDGDPANAALANLRWDTHSENNRDQVKHGTHPWATKPKCPYGHLLASPNLSRYAAAAGGRRCLACQRARRLKTAPFSQEIADEKYAEIMG